MKRFLQRISRKLNGIPLGCFLGLIAIVVAIFGGWIDLSDGLQILLMSTLVFVTWKYARSAHEQAEATKKMAGEMSEQRYDAVRPIIDIEVQQSSGSEMIRQGLYAREGEPPKAMLCTLRDIGLGPATNVYSLIEGPEGKSLWGDFGTLAKGEKTREIQLFLGQKNGRNVLVVYYRDIYGRPLESSREERVDKERGSIEGGPLRVRQLTEAEWPEFTITKVDIPPRCP